MKNKILEIGNKIFEYILAMIVCLGVILLLCSIETLIELYI